ncbi:O-methyltransferase [Microbacterium sp. ProA8]|uniref:O-methyltransferase n=1 Tax=Microbacterium chionoecetis TaxID=3153754 RepID=UPI0032677E28
MTGGFDYRHRPSKNIERHLILEVAQRFVHAYPNRKRPQYVGMGALEFLDFELMHRSLNVTKMYSIEKSDPTRFEFNKPFKTIRIVHASTTEALQRNEIDMTRPTIMWFDYTAALSESIVSDLKDVARNLHAPSLFFVTINCHPGLLEGRVDRLADAVGRNQLSSGLTDARLGGDGLRSEQWRIVDSVIRSAADERRDPAAWFQLVNFKYRDNAPMQTIGGLLAPPATKAADVTGWFSGMDFYSAGADVFDLRVPVITPRERAALDLQLPKLSKQPLKLRGIPPQELEAYRRVYRYFHHAGLQG